jgi:hypothetical protein
MINPNIKKQYPVIKMPNGHPISATMYNRNTSQGVVYTNNEEIINTDLAANLSTTSTVVANININHSIRSDLSATSELTNATITKVISLQSSISTNNTVSANTLVSKLLASNVTSTGTLAAALTVGGAFDADAQVFFDRVTTAGGTLTTTEKTAVNTLVIALKADGIWTKMKAIYPMVGASAASCAQNLVSASCTGTFSSGWTFASTGVKGNGTSAFMNTNYVESSNISINDGHLSIYNRTILSDNFGCALGASQSTLPSRSSFFLESNGLQSLNHFQQSINNYSPSRPRNGLQLWVITRINSNNFNLYSSDRLVTFSTSSTNILNIPYYLSALNTNGVAGNFSDKEYAFATMGNGLTESEQLNLRTRVQAFQTTLSRQV